MGTPARDEGLDNLEAFIVLLDGTRDRLEEGAERLEAVAGELAAGAAELVAEEQRLEQMLAEHLGQAGADEEDVAEGAEAVTSGGQGAMALAIALTTALAELSGGSASGAQAASAMSAALVEAGITVTQAVEAALETVITETGTLLAGDAEASTQLLRELLVQLNEAETAQQEEMAARAQQRAEQTETWLGEVGAARLALTTVMIAVTVVLVVIAIVVTVFTLGSASGPAVLAIAAAVAVIVAAIANLSTTIALNIVPLARGLAVILEHLGFKDESAGIEELLDSDLGKTMAKVVLLAAAVVSVVAALGSAAVLAPLLIALAMPVTVALRVVENVAQLLSALNPFD
jgi:hypothetical protein